MKPGPATGLRLLMIVALPAVELSLKFVEPPFTNMPIAPLFVKTVPLPAVALFMNFIDPTLRAVFTAVTKFCVIPELFVMPTPLILSVNPGLAVMV